LEQCHGARVRGDHEPEHPGGEAERVREHPVYESPAHAEREEVNRHGHVETPEITGRPESVQQRSPYLAQGEGRRGRPFPGLLDP